MRGVGLGIVLFRIAVCGALVAPGCTTVYHGARNNLPPEGNARVALRVEQARDAAKSAQAEVLRAADELAARPPKVTSSDAGGVVQSFGWELSRRVESIKDATQKTGIASPEVADAEAKLNRAVQRMEASAQALSKNLPEGPGSLTDCREALDQGIAAADKAIKGLRAAAPKPAGNSE